MKRILLLIIIILSILGCAGDKTSVETGANNDVDKRDQVSDSAVTDGAINVRIISKPDDKNTATTIIDTDKIVDIGFVATQTGYNSGDFTYNYRVLKDGNTDSQNSMAAGVFTPATNIRLINLSDAVGTYSFEVWAYNKKTGKKSAFGDGFTFKIISTTAAAISEDVLLNKVSLNKKNLYPGETLEVTYNLSNLGDSDKYITANTIFSGQLNVWKLTESNAPAKIGSGSNIEIRETYQLSESYIAAGGSALTNTHNVTSSIKIGESEATSSVINTIDVIIKERANIVLDSISPTADENRTVEPGQSNIRIDYNIINNGSNGAYIKSITPKFTKADGTDVSGDWIETGTNVRNPFIEGSQSQIITKTYTLKETAAGGDVYIDASVVAVIGNSYGLEVTYNNFKIKGKLRIQTTGSASVEAWIALPEGAKNGEIYTNQEITIYSIVNYTGTVSLSSKGSYEIVWAEIDGASLTSGDQTREDVTFNKQFQWTMRAGNQPIQGNIYIRVKNPPISSKTQMPIAFTQNVKAIPIKVVPSPAMTISAGVEEDNYGAKDGIVKAGTIEKIYAMVENTKTTKYMGNVKVKLDVSQIEGCTLAPGEVIEKTVVPGTKAVWSVKLPDAARSGAAVFEVSGADIDPKTGEKPMFVKETASVRIGSVLTGTIKLQEVKCDWVTAKPGTSGIPIAFVLENTGSAPIKITDLQGIFTQNGVDVSNKFVLTNKEDFYGTIIPAKTGNIEIRARYTLIDNMLDGSDILKTIRISGKATAIDTVMEEVMTDNIPTYNGWIYVIDTVPATLVVEEEISGKVGEPVMFDASESTDNFGIQYFEWDFDAADGFFDNSLAARGPKVYHTYTKPGIYKATVAISDGGTDTLIDGSVITIRPNGRIEKTITVTIE